MSEIRTLIEHHGTKRREALRVADEEAERLFELFPRAIEEGMTIAELQRLSAVSRPTIYARLKTASRATTRAAKALRKRAAA